MIDKTPVQATLILNLILATLSLVAVGTVPAMAKDPPALAPYTDPLGRFTVGVPKKDWLVVPSGGSALVILLEKKGAAAAVVEFKRLTQPLSPDDEIAQIFADVEKEVIRERQPQARDIDAHVETMKNQRLLIITFTQPGASGAERVRQYTFVKDTALYRLICSTLASRFGAFEPVFRDIAGSFLPKG